MKKRPFPAFSLKRAVLLPLVLVLVILFSGFISSFINQEKAHTKKSVGEQFITAKRALNTAIKIDTEKLSAALEIIDGNLELKRAMMAGDRDALLKQSGPLFNTLHEKYGITHFYFHQPDRVNFLRVHKPDRYGDKINRVSALQAEATGEPASALETGPLGLFTLRVVFPWYENEKLIGYVELGEEIEHLYTRIKDVINLDLYVIIDKRILSAKDWEAGMKMLGRKADWGFMPESVIAFTTLPEYNKPIFKHLMESGNLKPAVMELSADERIFQTYSLPLTDAGRSDLEIGKILFIRDVTDIKEQSIHHILYTIGLGIAVSGVLLLFFFLLTRRIEQTLLFSKKGLVQSEARFRSLVESSSDWIWEIDAKGNFVYSSPNVKGLLGYEAGEIIGTTPFELMPEEEAKRVSEEFIAISKERRPFSGLENSNHHKDGRILIMETSGVPIIDEEGTLTGYRGINRDITERKETEVALQSSLQKQKLLFESSRDALMMMAPPSWKFTGANEATLRLFGVSSLAEFTSLGPWNVAPKLQPDGRPSDEKAQEMIATAMREGANFFEWEHQRLDGQPFATDVLLTRMEVEGEKTFLQATVRDISDRKAAEAKLIESETRFRSLVESTPDWIWEIDANMHYVYASPKITELLGYEADEIIGKTPFELMPKEEAKRVSEEYAAISKERRPFSSLESTNRHKDGRMVIMETAGVPIIDEEGTLTGYRGIDRDITQRKHAEEALKKVTERFLLHFEQSPLGIIEWDTDFKVVEWNRAAERIFGYTKEEAKGCTAMDLIIPEDVKSHVSEIWADLLSGEGGYRSTNENVNKEGNIITCEWYNTPLVNADGEVIGVASLAEDVTEQKRAEARIIHMAYYDALTGLPNRALFKDRLEQECRIADRNNDFVGVVFIDIDFFKNVNESLGHLNGDLLLKAVATRLKESFRKSDTVAHFGGDEFAVVIPRLDDVNEIEHVIEYVTDRFKVPFTIMENELFVTFSIGYSFYPLDDTSADNLLRNSDTALNRAKELGRSQYQRYSIGMTDLASMHLSIQNGLRQALREGEFVLHYQPQTDLNSGVMTGVEALVRWQHPQKGMISPADFIPIAEETGLIVPMGEWILRMACLQAKAWQEQGLPNITMAVNLSSRQFKEAGFAQTVIEIIHETGLDPKYIELELTESILIDNESYVRKALSDFKKAGISLSIDDFGTGYSSLSYLKRFPIDKLKIDQSFVRDIIVDKSDASLVRAIIAMANALELKTIAEGVETQEQLDFLRAEGCEEIQGYFIAKPMPAEELHDFLKNR